MGLKILFLSHNFYPLIGGIEVVSDILATAFAKRGHEVHLLTWSPDPTNKEFLFTVIRKPTIATLFQEHYWADVVFENNPCLRLGWPKLFFGRPSVIGLHTWLPLALGVKGWQGQVKLSWLKHAKKVIACSEAIQKKCWPKSVVIGNPYRSEAFKVLPHISKNRNFVFLGRLVSDKGAELAIKAFHLVITEKNRVEKIPSDYNLTIIGEGPERQTLEELTSELGLSGNVMFTGSLQGEELVRLLNQHRFLLVPSLWEEPFGMVALEGMACGCLPIVSDGGGLPEAVDDIGLIFKRGDLEGLANCMEKVLYNPFVKNQFDKKIQDHLGSHQSDVVSKKYYEVIESVCRS